MNYERGIMKKFVILILVISILIVGCGVLMYEDPSYYKKSNWSCNADEFYGRYFYVIDNKITELQAKYGIDCEKRVETPEKDIIFYYLYTDTFTCSFRFTSNVQWGTYWGKLYFYGSDESQLDDYSAQKNLVDFLNEATHFFGYAIGNEENIFEQQYNYCIENGVDKSAVNLHFDQYVGYVTYGVGLKKDDCGYYYKVEKNSDLEIKANRYTFEGLLKGDIA